MYTYLHTYTYTRAHTCTQTQIHTYIHTLMQTCAHARTHTHTHTLTQHTHAHTHNHTHTYTYTQLLDHIHSLGLTIPDVARPWMRTLFASSLPLSHLLPLWDALVCLGPTFAIAVAAAVLARYIWRQIMYTFTKEPFHLNPPIFLHSVMHWCVSAPHSPQWLRQQCWPDIFGAKYSVLIKTTNQQQKRPRPLVVKYIICQNRLLFMHKRDLKYIHIILQVSFVH